MTEFGGPEPYKGRPHTRAMQQFRDQMAGQRPKTQLVVARHHVAFEEWCHNHNLNWADRSLVRYVQSWTDFRGYSHATAELVVLDGWAEGKNDYDIVNLQHEINEFRKRERNNG